jgi:hypothetical protein
MLSSDEIRMGLMVGAVTMIIGFVYLRVRARRKP